MKDKDEAVREWVAREFNAISQEWVRIAMEHFGYAEPLPMWGWMWIVDEYIGRKLWDNSRIMCADVDELRASLADNPNAYGAHERAELEKAIAAEDWSMLEQYIDEEMAGARCILDEHGNTTATYIYDIADDYVVGVHGAGWNFYDGVWDTLYDVCGIHWHEYADA